jgi:hypothetical protein
MEWIKKLLKVWDNKISRRNYIVAGERLCAEAEIRCRIIIRRSAYDGFYCYENMPFNK